MSIIIYKQMFRNPNYKDTPMCNYCHIRYIATRRGVINNHGMTHGLFGRLDPSGNTVHFNDWREVSKQAYELSKGQVNVFRSILSFQRKTANELGLTNQAAWQAYIEQHIPEIARQNNIKIENLQWACAVHNERGHPHAHIVFWDKMQRVMKKSVPAEIPDSIRRGLIKNTFETNIKDFFQKQYEEGNAIRKHMIKSTFADLLDGLYKDKDRLTGEIREITDEMVTTYEKYMRETYPREYAEMKAVFETFDESSMDAAPIYNCFNPDIVKALGEKLFALKDMMPETGRLHYKMLPPDIKTAVDDYVALLLKNNSSLRKSVNMYVAGKMKMLKLYTSDPKKWAKSKKEYTREAEKLIANRVLGAIKRILNEGREETYAARQEEYRQYAAEQLIVGLLDLFSRLCVSNGRQYDEFGGVGLGGELSKKARKEYYLAHKDQDKSIER